MPSTAIKVIGESFTSMGTGGTKKDNSAVAISGIILTTSDFHFDTVVLAADQANWVTGIKDKKVFPFFGLDSYEDQSTDATIYESATQRRKLLRLGKKRFMFNFDLPLDAHKAMQSYRNGDLRMFIVEEDGKIRFYNQSNAVWGFATSLVNPAKMKEVAPDGGTPALSALYIDMENFREWDEQGDFFTPTWEATVLEPLIPVDITKSDGSTGAIAASATAFTFAVGSNDGWTGAGARNRVGIKGLVKADFVFTKTAGTNQNSAVNTLTDNADGTYTAACTAFESGFVNLVAVASRSVTVDSLLVDSNGACTITVT
jgi:hypothetical protein